MSYTLPKAVDYKNLTKKALAALDWSRGLVQSKYDGCAVTIRVIGKSRSAVTPDNKLVRSIEHILVELPDGDYTVCGEMWAEGKTFEEINGASRRHTTQPFLDLIVFDFALQGEHDVPYYLRMDEAVRLLWHKPSIFLIDGYQCHWLDYEGAVVQAHMRQKHVAGLDGLIWRDKFAPFVPGRSKGDIIKIKPLVTYDLEVVGTETDLGDKTGKKVAVLLCRWSHNRIQRVSTGLDQAEQDYLYDNFCPKCNIVEVAGMGLTADGMLREPRFVRYRPDKETGEF